MCTPYPDIEPDRQLLLGKTYTYQELCTGESKQNLWNLRKCSFSETYINNETGGHSKTGGIRNVDMAKNGKNQLDGTYIERRSVNIGRRGKISYIHNQSKTKKLDGTPAEKNLIPRASVYFMSYLFCGCVSRGIFVYSPIKRC